MQDSITVAVTIDAPVREVWDVLVDPTLWWSGASWTLKIGAPFQEIWTEDGKDRIVTGKVFGIEPLSKLELSWKEEDWPLPMILAFTLTETAGVTEVSLTEEGWRMFPAEKRAQLMEAHKSGWKEHLRDLKEVVEAGA